MSEILWPGWRTVCKLGAGSFGAVYEIEREVFGETERAALKVIVLPKDDSETEELRSLGYDNESLTQHYKSCLEDIVREYTLMRKLKGHSNIVDCDDLRYIPHESGFGWRIFIKMELLTPLIKALDRLHGEADILRLGTDLCQALITCRKRNIIHRDIKPQNIFLSEDGNFKLGDFGIAKTAEKTSGGTKTGTYNYMAPEVYNNQPYGGAADIYSLGLVLYWLLNEHRMPFMPLPPQTPTPSMTEQARYRRFRGEPLPPPAHGSEALKQVVLKACAFDQNARYATPEDFLAALTAAKMGVGQQTPPPAWEAPEQEHTVGVWQHVPPRVTEPVERGEGTVGVFAQRHQPPVTAPVQAPPAPTPSPMPNTPPVASASPVSVHKPVPPAPPAPKPKKKWPWIVAIVLVFAAIGALVSWKDKPNATAHNENSTTEGSSVSITFDEYFYTDGDETPWLDLYYQTEEADGGTYVYFEPVVDTDYLTETYGPWYAEVYCFDSNSETVAYAYCADGEKQVDDEFCIFVDKFMTEGDYLWTAQVFQYGAEEPVSLITAQFTVEHVN